MSARIAAGLITLGIAMSTTMSAQAAPANESRGASIIVDDIIYATMLLHGDFSTFHANQNRPARVFSGDAYDNEMGVQAAGER